MAQPDHPLRRRIFGALADLIEALIAELIERHSTTDKK